ncbi:MAG: hypothetical protein Q9187_007251, partial [Circinaria calcarea]
DVAVARTISGLSELARLPPPPQTNPPRPHPPLLQPPVLPLPPTALRMPSDHWQYCLLPVKGEVLVR